MAGRHKISETDLDEWLRRPQWLPFAQSFGTGTHKSLEIDCAAAGPVFRVTDHGETRFLGTNSAAAVAAYNEAP